MGEELILYHLKTYVQYIDQATQDLAYEWRSKLTEAKRHDTAIAEGTDVQCEVRYHRYEYFRITV